MCCLASDRTCRAQLANPAQPAFGRNTCGGHTWRFEDGIDPPCRRGQHGCIRQGTTRQVKIPPEEAGPARSASALAGVSGSSCAPAG